MKLVLDIDDRVVNDELLSMRTNDCMVDMIKLLCAYHIPLGDIVPLAESIHFAIKDSLLLREGEILDECLPKKWYSGDMIKDTSADCNSSINDESSTLA